MQASDDYIVSHMADNSDIVLFLFKSSSVMAATKKKVCCSLCVVCCSIPVSLQHTGLSLLCNKTTKSAWLTLVGAEILEKQIMGIENRWKF